MSYNEIVVTLEIMTDETRQLLQAAAEALKAAGAREVYVFGSAARGALRPGSDLDLAVSGLPPQRFFQAMGQAQMAIRRSLDLIDLDDDTPFVRLLRERGELRLVA